MTEWYKEDLAFIHDVGFSDYALKSAAGILEILHQRHIRSGLVVDLGCGTGLWTQELAKADYQVLGVDISEAAIAIARTRVPNAEFRVESLFKTGIPPCNAVTAISECLNYLFDPDNQRETLNQLFHRIYHALIPGGVLVFDIIELGDVPVEMTKGFKEGKDWIVLVEKEEDHDLAILTRKIITFRKIGEYYRRDDEVHRQRLYKEEDIVTELSQVGFQVQTMRSYGQYTLPQGRVAFVAGKPG
ncbi:class I SAM-dependent methyltransferase [Microcoleus sp. FACHB-68]|uniref:class I SAM-dependent methyltransferase n=1 Tax=Microcoleus sp. FACHB-68 TaxID=2692826 RepID=UPI001689BEAA|nr:class I SAM-dependent methyltransferase [Microcoleus sp. FACHB-68]MBD1937371.1 class I SAM-dependent methyltransferase [Microcoleus sp. FACHB-68]